MSRVAKMPVDLPQGVSATIAADAVTLKGAKGTLTLAIKNGIKVVQQEKRLQVEALDAAAEGMNAVAGATRAHLANMVTGVTKGYEKKLELVGVGYRAAVQAKNLTLTLGYSHLINYAIPDGISIETPSQTEIIVRGIDRQRVGQTAAEIRGFRPPEPYKGKGVKYSDETISLKEAKKK
ncbi:MAG TPA: 50S ribosomal protein L6 [Steroidobacteraceae bacterium]|nr:50S ribosomal protein L6 [Steroidobacteraceae bacterium]